MRIAVVIPALHEADRIRAAVRSAQGPDVDVIVADGGSADATQELARAEGARVVDSEPGRARQLAAGLAAVGPEASAVLFLHADTELPRGWAARVREALLDPSVVGGAFGFRLRGQGLALRFIEAWVKVRLALFRLPYGDQGIFARPSALSAMGGVPQVPIMEDLDLVHGLRAQGRLVLLPEPALTSPRRYDARGRARTVVRNLGALLAWRLGLDRDRVAAWYRR